jgi:DNA-directed RNA polymerase
LRLILRWATAEEPFQALAAAFEITAAIRSGSPENYETSFPVHQDGSCNGLQHYAALGRDFDGAVAVNLVDAKAPQDVYSKVLDIVMDKMEQDCLIDENASDRVQQLKGSCARLLKGHVSRKVIKQTVMTSVYGVTRQGGRLQVMARLVETPLGRDPQNLNALRTPEVEAMIAACSG